MYTETLIVSIASGVVTLLGASFSVFLAFRLTRVSDRLEDMRRKNDHLSRRICQSRHELTIQVMHLRVKVVDPGGEVGKILDEMDQSINHLQCDV